MFSLLIKVLKPHRLKLHILMQLFFLIIKLFFLQKLINLITLTTLHLKTVILVVSGISRLPVPLIFMIILVINVMALLTCTRLWAWLVIQEAWTILFKTVGLFTWTVDKRIRCRVNNKRIFMLLFWCEEIILSIWHHHSTITPKLLVLNFSLFPI